MLVEALALLAGGPAPHHFLNPLNTHPDFTVATIAGTLIVLRRTDLLAAMALGLLFEAARVGFLAWHHVSLAGTLPSTGVGVWGAFLVLALLRALRERGAARQAALDRAAMAFVLPATIPLLVFFLWLTTIALPATGDLYLYAFDGLLPVPLAQLIATGFVRSPAVGQFFWMVYHALIGVLGIYILLERKPDGQPGGHLLSRWLLAGCLGYMLYFLLPGTGPRYAFADLFPLALPAPGEVNPAALLVPAGFARNAIPSLHATWAFLIVLAARNMSLPARAAALAFMIATLVATLGLGEHYLIDLVVALPFTVAIEGLASFSQAGTCNRWSAAAALSGAGMTLGWLLALRYGIDVFRAVPSSAGVLVLATIAASVGLLWRQPAGQAGERRPGRQQEAAGAIPA